MKKFYFSTPTHLLGILTLILFFIGFSLSAQQMFIEHNLDTLENNIKYERHFDASDYTMILDSNKNKVYLKSQTFIQDISQVENATNSGLSINLGFDASQFYVASVLIFNETGYMQTAHWNGTNPMVVNVPDGTYDVMTEFQSLNSGKSHVVINELQIVQGNTTVQLNSADAVNYVSITTYNENGDILEPEAGVGGSIFFDRTFYFNPSNLVTIADYYFETDPFGGTDPTWNFYINNVSNRYSIIQTMMGVGYDQGNYFSKYETITGVSENVSIENNPTDWSYHSELFQPTKSASTDIAPAYFAASTFNGNLIIGWTVSAGGIIDAGNAPFRGYLNNPLNNDPADLLVIPGIIDRYVSFSPTTGGISYFTKGNSVFSDGNGGVLYGSGDVSANSHTGMLDYVPLLGNDYYVMNTNEVKLLPFHPKFSFDNSSTPSVILGDNVPIAVTGFDLVSNTFLIANKGRYGETRESDFLATQIEVMRNGIVVFSGTYEDFKTFNLPTTGQFEIVLTNANTLLDGLDGTNTTTITYNADEDDGPPTLQHLQFRDVDDKVTSVLDSSQGATLRLAAGDFNYTMIDETSGYYTYEEGNNVTVAYSLYNQNNWTALELTQYPEYSEMQAFGDYYEASLDGIGDAAGYAWFDVKVTCTDSGGNIQEQIISPAFKINQTLSTNDILETNFSVYPNPFSEQLNVIIPKSVTGNYIFRVTDLIGRTVYSKNQSDTSFGWNSSFLSQGIYILAIERNGRSISKKVIKI